MEALKHPGLKHTLNFQILKVNLLFQNLKDQQATPRQLSARHCKFSPWAVLPRMFPFPRYVPGMNILEGRRGCSLSPGSLLWHPQHSLLQLWEQGHQTVLTLLAGGCKWPLSF